MAENPFYQQVVIVTGASSGIGRQVALQLAAQGAWLALAARRAERLEEVVAHCQAQGGRALAVPTDVTDEQQCRALVARTVEEYGRLDMLVNDAGISPSGRFDELSDLAVVEEVMRVNYLGSVYCTYYALPHLQQTRGRIVALSSLSAVTGMPKLSAYVASKKAMVGFFDSLRAELGPGGVSVTVIYPSYVDTRDSRPADEPAPAGAMSPETCARLILAAAARRKREEVMTAQGKLARWFKLIAPEMMDRIARRTIDQYL
jgi:NAD(P)-dependent dehydrogenase (short-subunit alcohol dehydrogenase family)